jgi:hypothetical protein
LPAAVAELLEPEGLDEALAPLAPLDAEEPLDVADPLGPELPGTPG